MFNRLKKLYKTIRFNSKDYWENRYKKGGDSGAGSYGERAKYKASVVNKIVEDYNISSVIEFGCGDGNNLGFYNIEYYTGFDVSETAIEICLSKYENDLSKSFIWYNPRLFKPGGFKSDLTLSLEVIFHLIEDEVFLKYMKNLFDTSSKYVCICSSNEEQGNDTSVHVKHRKFTDFIPSEFTLLKHIKTPREGELKDFFSDFYLYKRSY